MNNKTELSINEDTMIGFYSEMLPIVGNEHCLLGIDIISKFSYQGITETLNYNYSVHEYYSEVFDSFLHEKVKLCPSNKYEDIYRFIGNEQYTKYSNLQSNALSFVIIPDYDGEHEVNIDEYITILNGLEFGQSFVWLNHITEEESPSSISILLIFNRAVCLEELANIKYLSYKILINRAIRLIDNKIRKIIKQQHKSEMAHLGHTINSIFPPSFSKLQKIKEINNTSWKDYNSLVFIIKSFTIAHMIYQFASNQHPVQIKEKNILQFLNFLKEHSTSIHDCSIDVKIDTSKLKIIESPVVCEDVFILLWNIWYNAEKFTGRCNGPEDQSRKILVELFESNNFIVISFSNKGIKKIELETKLFLMDKSQKPYDKDVKEGKGGVSIIKSKLKSLDWSVDIPLDDVYELENLDIEGVKKDFPFFLTKIVLTTNISL